MQLENLEQEMLTKYISWYIKKTDNILNIYIVNWNILADDLLFFYLMYNYSFFLFW